jgi:hypothetical protein
MVRGFDELPQLERITVWFPGVFNAHAVIIARNARNPRWAWQGEGREVMQTWARKVVAASPRRSLRRLPSRTQEVSPPAREEDRSRRIVPFHHHVPGIHRIPLSRDFSCRGKPQTLRDLG